MQLQHFLVVQQVHHHYRHDNNYHTIIIIITSQGVGSALMGLRSMSSDSPEVLDLLQVLELKILPMAASEPFNVLSITSAMHGLQGMSDKHPEVRRMLAVLFKRLRYNDITTTTTNTITTKQRSNKATIQHRQSLSPVEVSNLLMGFKNMQGCVEVDMFMSLIADRWIISDDGDDTTTSTGDGDEDGGNSSGDNNRSSSGGSSFSSVDIALSLYGLQSIVIEQCPAVTTILGKLTTAISKANNNNINSNHINYLLSSKHVGIAMYGLKTLSIHHNITEIPKLISALATNIAAHPRDPLSAQSLGMVMLGLSGCSSDRTDVCALLQAVIPRVSELDPQSCSNVLSSMYNMRSDQKEVRLFLREISRHMDRFTTPLSPSELSAAYYGLQGMSANHREVIDILSALNKKLVTTAAANLFTSQDIGNMLLGLQSMSTSAVATTRSTKSDSSSGSGKKGLSNSASSLEPSLSTILTTLGNAADLIDRCSGIMKPRDIASALYGENFARLAC